MLRPSRPVNGSCGIAVMAKASKAGLTKTRLAPCIGMGEAARLNTAFLRDAAANVVRAGQILRESLEAPDDASLHGYMAYGPPGEGGFFDFLPDGIGLIEAWQASFGDTLMQAFAGLLDRGHAGACLINADSPTLPPALLAEAARMLLAPGERVVLGPSTDGGYYLIGARRLHADLFEGISWSTAAVFEQTLDRAARIGLDVCVLPVWYDVDDAASLDTLRAELFDGMPFGAPDLRGGEARHTREMLAAIDGARQPAAVP